LPHAPGVAEAVISAEEIVGEIVSRTVIVKEQLAVLPDESLAVELTVVTPIGKSDPET
jgi:hypothetical protein